MAEGDISAAEAAELRKEAAKYRAQLRELEAKVDGLDLAKAKELLTKQASDEEELLKQRGQFDELLRVEKDKLTKEIADREAKAADWRQKFERSTIDTAILSVSADAINPRQLATLLRTDFSFSVDDSGAVKIKDSSGKDVAEGVDKVVGKYLADNPHLARPKGGGAGSSGGGGGGGARDETPLGQIKAGLKKEFGIG